MSATVAVTTTADRYPRWSEPLQRRGFRPVHLPCLQIRPVEDLEEIRRRSGGADWLMVTSSRVIDILWPDGGMPPVPVAAVGEITAQKVRAAGGVAAVVGTTDGDELVRLMTGRVTGARVVVPRGARADTERFRRLAREGAEVETPVLYHTVSVPPGEEPVEGAVFGSPSAVEGWSMSRSLRSLLWVGAIGPVTAEALRRHGVASPVVAGRPDPDSLAAAMSASLETTS